MGGKNSAESINRYMSKTYDRITILVKKGRKDEIKAHAAAQGESVNAFLQRAISEAIERDKAIQSGFAVPEKTPDE